MEFLLHLPLPRWSWCPSMGGPAVVTLSWWCVFFSSKVDKMTDIVTGNPLVVKMIVGFNRYQYSQLLVVKIGCVYKLLIEYLPHLGIILLEEMCVFMWLHLYVCLQLLFCVCVRCKCAANLHFSFKCRSGSIIFDIQTVSAKAFTLCAVCSFLLVIVITWINWLTHNSDAWEHCVYQNSPTTQCYMLTVFGRVVCVQAPAC